MWYFEAVTGICWVSTKMIPANRIRIWVPIRSSKHPGCFGKRQLRFLIIYKYYLSAG